MDLTERSSALNEFNLPPEDYDERGQVRVLRKRMLKKLFKYELKAIFSWTWVALAVLAGVTVLTACSLSFYDDDFTSLVSVILPLILYVYVVVGASLTPLIAASVRHNKNFFKSQGYLTFSIPASEEEHVFAKHVSALAAFCLSLVAALVSVAIVGAVASATFDLGGGESTVAPFLDGTDFLSVIESILYAILIPIAIVCLSGALDCWAQKFKKKRQIFFRVLIAYFVITTLESTVMTLALEGAFQFFSTPVGAHVSAWLGLLALAGITVLSLWYELRTLKKKLNLK